MFALGLPGFCTFLYMVRVLQAMQDTRTAFRLYLVENGINIVFGVALVGPLGVRGLALSLSIAYTVAAVMALGVIRRRVGGSAATDLTTPVKRVVAATAVMAVATVLALNVSGATSGFGLLARVVLAVVVGVVAYVGHGGGPGRTCRPRGRGRAAARRARSAASRPPRRPGGVRPERPTGTTRHRARSMADSTTAPPSPAPAPATGGRAAGSRPPGDEEEAHGPDPGGNR